MEYNLRKIQTVDKDLPGGIMEYRIATETDIESFMEIRLEMLRKVNDLPENYAFSGEFIQNSKCFFEHGDQTTTIAVENGRVVGCASMVYVEVMPTFSHPTGHRAHLMNVYTHEDYRRRGVARRLVQMLMEEAKDRGVTEISLDATASGRPLYESLGFKTSDECMVFLQKRE